MNSYQINMSQFFSGFSFAIVSKESTFENRLLEFRVDNYVRVSVARQSRGP